MLYNKPATTVEDQVQNLKGRGLVCDDEPRAIRHMRSIGYYRLSAYWLFFEDPPAARQTRSRLFSQGTTWAEVMKLYAADRRLRILIMEAIERIEVAIRAAWTNRLTLAYGSHPHLDPSIFRNTLQNPHHTHAKIWELYI